MRSASLACFFLATALGVGAVPATPELAPVLLCITEGRLDGAGGGRSSVNVPKMRAYAVRPDADVAELDFVYLGPTGTRAALASGATRVQFGLKLRAQDACNLVYVMWRVAPAANLVVSVKSNPLQHTSAECSNHGYRNVKADRSSAAPALEPGSEHRLRAQLRGPRLQVFIDGGLVWDGGLDADARQLKGPAGVRTDNAHLEFTLSADQGATPGAGSADNCRKGSEDSD